MLGTRKFSIKTRTQLYFHCTNGIEHAKTTHYSRTLRLRKITRLAIPKKQSQMGIFVFLPIKKVRVRCQININSNKIDGIADSRLLQHAKYHLTDQKELKTEIWVAKVLCSFNRYTQNEIPTHYTTNRQHSEIYRRTGNKSSTCTLNRSYNNS